MKSEQHVYFGTDEVLGERLWKSVIEGRGFWGDEEMDVFSAGFVPAPQCSQTQCGSKCILQSNRFLFIGFEAAQKWKNIKDAPISNAPGKCFFCDLTFSTDK